MATRSSFVQIRVTPREKAALRRLAAAAGQDLTSYVLARALPPNRLRFEEILRLLRGGAEHPFVLAELNDFLSELASVEFHDSVGSADLSGTSPFLANYVAAMVEHAAHLKGVDPPGWTREVAPLELPHFASPLRGLRVHLLREAPVAFKRRNIFVDASIGARV